MYFFTSHDDPRICTCLYFGFITTLSSSNNCIGGSITNDYQHLEATIFCLSSISIFASGFFIFYRFFFVQIILFWFIFSYDTPRFLSQNDKDEQCLQCLHKIYVNESEINQVYKEIKNLIKEESSSSCVPISK